MSERPFMQLYTSDFLGDTQFLSAEYIGAYLLLLMTMWNNDGWLDNEEVTLARVSRLTVEEWRLAWTKLSRFFEVQGDRLTHARVTLELSKFARKSAARKEAGRKGGAAKALKDKNPTLANAKAIGMASSRNQIKKARATLLVPTDEPVRLDKHIHTELFAACLSIAEGVPSWAEHWSFPRDVVAQARAMLGNSGKPN
jgi:uncharacterized protein YdaU (DUF1376 family)